MTRPPLRILIVDDHDVVRRGLRDLLWSNSRHRVVGEASEGHDALAKAERLRPDIIIFGYSLRLLNGLGLAVALQRSQPQVELLLFTFHDSDQLTLDALRAGIRGIVFKSDPERHIIAALDALGDGRPYFSHTKSEVLDRIPNPGSRTPRVRLTHCQRRIVQLIAEGQHNREIAHRLSISVKTVESHRATAMHRLKLRGTADLVRYAVLNKIAMA